MPTGYTAPVQSGEITEFKDFAMRCARNFGALMSMRDEPTNAPIPNEFTPSDYNARRHIEARQRLDEVTAWTTDRAESEALIAHDKAMDAYEESLVRTAAENARYRAMLEKVESWPPPTPEHQGLKEFMIEQLTQSMRFDNYEPTEPARLTGQAYKSQEIESAAYDIGYHAKKQREENERTQTRNDWVRALRASLI